MSFSRMATQERRNQKHRESSSMQFYTGLSKTRLTQTNRPHEFVLRDHYGIRRSEGWKQAFLALKSLHCLSVASLQTLARGVCFQGEGRTGLDFLVTFASRQK